MAPTMFSRRVCLALTVTLSSSFLCSVYGFSPSLPTTSISTPRSSSRLYEIIESDGRTAADIDFGQGGVRLAQESAIKIVGSINHSPGKASPETSNLLRYTDLRKIDDGQSKVASVLEQSYGGSARVIATGQGVELYKDPGETVIKEIFFGPMEAVKDAFSTAASAMEYEKLVLNFLGGDDLIAGEVYDAATELVIMLDIATKAKVEFNSLCHSSIPSETCTVTVVGLPSAAPEAAGTGIEKAIASGEVYSRDGVWYTVIEEDINTAVA